MESGFAEIGWGRWRLGLRIDLEAGVARGCSESETMNALRLHKGTVPGREKLRDARRLLQASRQRAARGSLLQVLRSFLTADSFMYGPLLQEQREQSLTPTPVHHLSDDDDHDNRDHHDSEPRTPGTTILLINSSGPKP